MTNCGWCDLAVDEATESHVRDLLSIYHINCWNLMQEARHSQDEPDEREDPQYWRGQTLADVGMCEADFR